MPSGHSGSSRMRQSVKSPESASRSTCASTSMLLTSGLRTTCAHARRRCRGASGVPRGRATTATAIRRSLREMARHAPRAYWRRVGCCQKVSGRPRAVVVRSNCGVASTRGGLPRSRVAPEAARAPVAVGNGTMNRPSATTKAVVDVMTAAHRDRCGSRVNGRHHRSRSCPGSWRGRHTSFGTWRIRRIMSGVPGHPRLSSVLPVVRGRQRRDDLGNKVIERERTGFLLDALELHVTECHARQFLG
jgi:hypothetical protein